MDTIKICKILTKIANKADALGKHNLASDIDEVAASILKAAQDDDYEDLDHMSEKDLIGMDNEELLGSFTAGPTGVEEITDDNTSDRIRNAFMANPDNVSKVLATRNPGPNAAGSVFMEPQTPGGLMNANWEPYSHPDVKPPAVAFRAKIPGSIGIIDLSNVSPDSRVSLVEAHDTGFLSPVVDGVRDASSEYTTLLLGPIDEDGTEGVWTFFPGDPVAPSTLPTDDVPPDKREVSAREAMNMGFKYAKIAG